VVCFIDSIFLYEPYISINDPRYHRLDFHTVLYSINNARKVGTVRILKKNGAAEELEIAKIKTSIANSANDIGLPFTESDLNILLREIVKELYKLNCNSFGISSNEVRRIVYKVLIEHGFYKTAKSYIDVDL
jgi:hypothetical protein